MDKRDRLRLFYDRLSSAPPASTAEEAYSLICNTLNAVEDEWSGVPNEPANWRMDGRMYPPRTERLYAVSGFPNVFRYNSFKHDTYISPHGAIEVRAVATGRVEFSKAGAGGKGVWE